VLTRATFDIYFVGRPKGGKKDYAVQIECFLGSSGNRDMSFVDGIKGASIESDALGLGHANL